MKPYSTFIVISGLCASLYGCDQPVQDLEPFLPAVFEQDPLARAHAHLSRREFRQALVAYEEARIQYPNSGEPLAGMGRIEVVRGDLERAVLYHQMAAALSDDLTGPTFALGNLYLRLNRVDEAADVFLKMVVAHPDFPPARRNLAAAYVKQGRTTSALEQYEEALRIEPRHTATKVNISRLLLSLSRLEEAAGHLEAVLRDHPEDASLLHDLGRVRARDGARDLARELFERALAADSTHAGSYFQLGMLEFESGKLPEAERFFKAALIRNPGLAEPYRFLAQTYLRQGRISAGEAGLQQYEKVKQVEDEIRMYEQRLQDDPLDTQASFGLGYHYARLNLLARARMYYEHTLTIYPQHAPAWNNLAGLLLRLGKADGAANAYRNSMASDSTYTQARTNLARLEHARSNATIGAEMMQTMAFDSTIATTQTTDSSVHPGELAR